MMIHEERRDRYNPLVKPTNSRVKEYNLVQYTCLKNCEGDNTVMAVVTAVDAMPIC